MLKHSPDIILPTPEEDAQIIAAIAADPDDDELDDAWFDHAVPATEIFEGDTLLALTSLQQASMGLIAVTDPETLPKTVAFIGAHPRG